MVAVPTIATKLIVYNGSYKSSSDLSADKAAPRKCISMVENNGGRVKLVRKILSMPVEDPNNIEKRISAYLDNEGIKRVIPTVEDLLDIPKKPSFSLPSIKKGGLSLIARKRGLTMESLFAKNK
jgi:hypothetical protein